MAEDSLAELIERERSEIERRFAERLYAASAAGSLDHQTVIDSLHPLLDEIVAALRRGGFDPTEQQVPTSHAAVEHGQQRYSLGYDVATLVREYGLLQQILFDLIEERGARVSLRHLRTLALAFANAVSDASMQYAHMRDEELHRQASQHIGFLAHELRDPLGAAQLAVALAREQGSLASPRVIDAIERGLKRMAQRVDDALVEVRLRASGDLTLEPIAIEALVASVLEESAANAQAKRLTLRSELDEGLELEADARVLRSAVSNLVRNAVKFSHPAGTVVVRAVDAEGRVRIEVEDSCGGLPEGAVEKVFDPFVQVGTDRSGFGLGLAIAKQAAMAHDGEIRVHNLPGKGCVFVIDLPRVRETD